MTKKIKAVDITVASSPVLDMNNMPKDTSPSKNIEPINDIEDTPAITTDQPATTDEPPKKDIKVLELVKCDKCNKKMTEKTLKYAHLDKCPANKAKISTKNAIAKKAIITEPATQQASPMFQSPILLRQENINRKKESYKEVFKNAF